MWIYLTPCTARIHRWTRHVSHHVRNRVERQRHKASDESQLLPFRCCSSSRQNRCSNEAPPLVIVVSIVVILVPASFASRGPYRSRTICNHQIKPPRSLASFSSCWVSKRPLYFLSSIFTIPHDLNFLFHQLFEFLQLQLCQEERSCAAPYFILLLGFSPSNESLFCEPIWQPT